MRFTATSLRANLYWVLDLVAKTGVPVEIERAGKVLRIVPAGARNKLAGLKRRKRYLAVDPESLVHIDWSGEWRP
ncbi:MAG: type II toxin-antitoxin system Phd/YefM family antitoxin [Betaproteobacteria bacterium]|nr:type II toxin-antitoxin system Phd/YefM family antitoxin [Betaproteobacteria bacterium]MSQ87901.1 type II toxin-antitoxin system Phd/YefM family antitoxin [Betaproteobacteria bacterium]